ncbi:hypothetical protein OG928_44225 (plasmid) [Embleya sp. NBC_00896]|nr:hypothetical protein OG928_44225 [Embleya sp. NBC_00896]
MLTRIGARLAQMAGTTAADRHLGQLVRPHRRQAGDDGRRRERNGRDGDFRRPTGRSRFARFVCRLTGGCEVRVQLPSEVGCRVEGPGLCVRADGVDPGILVSPAILRRRDDVVGRAPGTSVGQEDLILDRPAVLGHVPDSMCRVLHGDPTTVDEHRGGALCPGQEPTGLCQCPGFVTEILARHNEDQVLVGL